MTKNFNTPKEVIKTTETLEEGGFEAYLVGGCVRDILIGREPKDWDITTNAKPEEVIKLFTKTVYENKFGTVAVINEETENPKLKVIEITPYRLETKYSDFRHPDEVKFSSKLEDDLKRRDFTVNAMAYSVSKNELVDLYNGQQDLKDKSLRTVGDANERFEEDALRMIRAIRFAVELDFTVTHETMQGITAKSDLIKNISLERIHDEFEKIIMSPNPMIGIVLLNKFGLLKHFIPELEEGIGCEQKGEHIYDVWEHLLHALEHAGNKAWPLHIRLAALFHDIGKPRTRRWDGSKAGGKGKYTFFGHEVVGARMTEKIMDRLKFPKKVKDIVVTLVRYHMFFSDPEKITLSAVRRVIVNVGPENIWDLMSIRECDRVGMKKVEAPYRLRKYHSMIEEALRAPTSVGMLKIDGNKIMGITKGNLPAGRQEAGPWIGWTLHALLEEALENPDINTEEYLKKRVVELSKLSDSELRKLGEAGKEKKEEAEQEELGEIRKKYGVK